MKKEAIVLRADGSYRRRRLTYGPREASVRIDGTPGAYQPALAVLAPPVAVDALPPPGAAPVGAVAWRAIGVWHDADAWGIPPSGERPPLEEQWAEMRGWYTRAYIAAAEGAEEGKAFKQLTIPLMVLAALTTTAAAVIGVVQGVL